MRDLLMRVELWQISVSILSCFFLFSCAGFVVTKPVPRWGRRIIIFLAVFFFLVFNFFAHFLSR